jgi:hypothetical protein
MRRVRPLRFDALEARELLTRAHPAIALRAHAVARPLVLNGTLTVDPSPSATTASMNPDGSSSTSVRVTGTLGALGAVQGTWNVSTDSLGDSSGVETLRLHNASGTVLIVLNTQTASRSYPAGHGAVYQEYAQRLYAGTGPYAGTSESGSIKLVSNKTQTMITTLAVHTKGT